jgi:type II secretory pathway component PulL
MPTLLVRFHDASLDHFSWIIEGVQAEDSAANWRVGSAQELGTLSQNRGSVVFIIPQQCVYLTQFEIPANASRQVLSSIEYQIEDQLAQDVERQHVALGDQSSNPVAVAVVEEAIMERALELQKTNGLSLSRIVPEMFLCPWSGQAGEVIVIESHDGLILRYGDYKGLKCRVEMLESVLNQITQEQEISHIVYYLQNRDRYENVQITRYPSEHRVLDLDQLKIDRAVSIDLQQRRFQVSSVWLGLFKVWRWIIKVTQYELIKRYLPSDVDESANLKKVLITVLRQNQSSQRDIDFLGLLSAFTQAKVEFPTIAVNKIGYQKDRLSIDVKTGRLSEIEALYQAIETAGQAVELENLDIKPEATSGRFVLTGKSI